MRNRPNKPHRASRTNDEKPMRRAAVDLATIPDERLFEEMAQGIGHIVGNATSLNKAALTLHEAGQHRAGAILRGFVEEESAKILILIDAIRSPREKRGSTLKRFYNHLAKRIYADATFHARFYTFEGICMFVDRQRRRYFLDGPNGVDWIFPNEVLSERERAIYVDFMKDTTHLSGEYFWSFPFDTEDSGHAYEPPAVLTLAQALADAGAASPRGLAIFADAWRQFVPSESTQLQDLREHIKLTLEDLVRRGIATCDQASIDFIFSHWTFPLWPLDLSFSSDNPSIEDLKSERNEEITRLKDVAALRNPAPAITREKVEFMHKAYAEWKHDAEQYDRETYPNRQGPGLHIRDPGEFDGCYQLPSYVSLKTKLQSLATGERTALLALANFARNRVPDWPSSIKTANEVINLCDDDHQVSLGQYWLEGLDRWETPPPSFRAGQFFHH